MTELDCGKIKENIEKIEKAWKEDLRKPHGGGLNSKTNESLMSLRIIYNKMCKSDDG